MQLATIKQRTFNKKQQLLSEKTEDNPYATRKEYRVKSTERIIRKVKVGSGKLPDRRTLQQAVISAKQELRTEKRYAIGIQQISFRELRALKKKV